jgi:sec-independent protein translocase protein TatB
MFDISFFEMVVIGVVALIVIGPERLPGVARTAGHLFGRMQRYVSEVKSDIQREIELDELKKLRESVEDSAREIEQSVNREFDRADQEMRELQDLVDPARRPGSGQAGADPALSATEPGAAPAGLEPQVADAVPVRPEAPAQAPKTA